MCKIHMEICLPEREEDIKVPTKEKAIFTLKLWMKGNNVLTKGIRRQNVAEEKEGGVS